MERQTALVIAILCFVVFLILAYYGAQLRIWSSVVLATFLTLILLVAFFYTPAQTASDTADYTLYLYAFLVLLGILILFIYIITNTLTDIRKC